jgi:putative transposase
VALMCRLLGVSRSGYYDWDRRAASDQQRRRARLTRQIQAVFVASHRTYGYRRVHATLVGQGVEVDDDLVRRLMGAAGLVPVQVKRRRGLTVADRAAGPVPDLIRRDFTASVPGAKMVGDITQINTRQGPLFLATVIDCYSKAVLGWSVNDHCRAELVCAAMRMAADRIPLPEGAIFHSDRGGQYTSYDFACVLRDNEVRHSVGRTGVCYDNSMAESFFGKFKTEWVHHRSFATREEARRESIKFIEGFYNARRLHSALGYRAPHEVLDEWFTHQRVA